MFIDILNFSLSGVEHDKNFITLGPGCGVLTAEISSLVVNVSLVIGLTTVGMMVSNLLVSLPGSSNT